MKIATIYLGSKCNLNCSYCHKEPSKNECGITDKFIKYLKEQSDLEQINFIGGEPTLYFDEIKKIVREFPNLRFKITTNGKDLEKYIDYLREHRFKVIISYDGSEINLRNYNPFNKILDYPNLGISCTLFHGNTNFNKILKDFSEKEKIIEHNLIFFPHLIHYTSENNKKYALTKQDYDFILEQYKSCIIEYIYDYINFGIVNKKYGGLFNQLVARYNANYEFGETYCTNKIINKFDTEGNSKTCLYIRDENSSDLPDIIRKKFPECENCNVYHMCGSGCVKEINHKLECNFHKKLYSWFKEFYKPYERIMRQ